MILGKSKSNARIMEKSKVEKEKEKEMYIEVKHLKLSKLKVIFTCFKGH